jgi:predicted nucleotidyltransferase
MFLTLGGSHAYGTNNESSDVDIRGCAMYNASEIVGLSNFEQFINTETDTTVYSFNKLIGLLLNCNPNTIEMLGCKPEHYIYMTDAGKQMIDNRKMFLSKRAVYSFGGYANQQLNRLENALARDRVDQAQKEEHMCRSMENSVASFESRYTNFDAGSIKLFTDVSQREGMEREIFADIHLEHFPARQFNSMMNDLHNVLGTYEKLNHRNHKKDDAHLNKHAMHLVRLYLMCIDILEKEEIITYREADHDLLMSIRNGDYMHPNGTYRDEFFLLVDRLKDRLDYAKENTSLPAHPNMKDVEEFVMEVNKRAIGARN